MGEELMKIELKDEVDRIMLADLFLQFAREILAGTVEIGGQYIEIPDILDVELEYKCKEEGSEIELEIKWC